MNSRRSWAGARLIWIALERRSVGVFGVVEASHRPERVPPYGEREGIGRMRPRQLRRRLMCGLEITGAEQRQHQSGAGVDREGRIVGSERAPVRVARLQIAAFREEAVAGCRVFGRGLLRPLGIERHGGQQCKHRGDGNKNARLHRGSDPQIYF